MSVNHAFYMLDVSIQLRAKALCFDNAYEHHAFSFDTRLDERCMADDLMRICTSTTNFCAMLGRDNFVAATQGIP